PGSRVRRYAIARGERQLQLHDPRAAGAVAIQVDLAQFARCPFAGVGDPCLQGTEPAVEVVAVHHGRRGAIETGQLEGARAVAAADTVGYGQCGRELDGPAAALHRDRRRHVVDTEFVQHAMEPRPEATVRSGDAVDALDRFG